MTTDLAMVEVSAGLDEIRDKIIGHQQRILPVVRDGELAGVITRTDLLNSLVRYTTDTPGETQEPHSRLIHARTRNIANLMGERIPAPLRALLKTMGQVAHESQMEVYVVGGFVRDLFLYRANEDTDVVVEGNGIEFAKKLAKQVNARIHTHRKFGTAVVIFPDGFKVDVATARMEYYQSPAALPIIENSSIKLDLYRRDFTINTLAIHLNPGHFGILIDFFAGRRDIKEKAIRVLHNLSFVEDPTRAFRAIRFEQRFGFTIGRLTASLIQNAVKLDFFKRLSGRRVFAELRLILQEEDPVAALKRLEDFQLLGIIHPAIQLDEIVLKRLSRVKTVLAWHDLLFLDDSYMRWAVYFMALVGHCDAATTLEICMRLELAARYQELFVKARFKAEDSLNWLQWRKTANNVEIYTHLHGLKNELILYIMAATEERAVQQMVSLYYTKLRHIQPLLQGKDLQTMGIPPGPIYREILDAILEARLEGRITTRQEETALVKAYGG
jgi:tRNA nucleotidyltransferase (CCA-adding enzyme)